MLQLEHRVGGESASRGAVGQLRQLDVGRLVALFSTTRAAHDHVLEVLGVGPDDYIAGTQVATHLELVDRRRVEVADLRLLAVVTDTHADRLVACQAPAVEGHLETDDENTLMGLGAALSQRVHTVIRVERKMLLVVEIRWVILVLALALTLQSILNPLHRRLMTYLITIINYRMI